MNPARYDGQRRHLLVAGTGRAGTSALVRYLTGLGLETHLSRNGGASGFDDAALAGLEDVPLPSVTPDLPYVVKSPWSYQIIEEILEEPRMALDAVVVPVRDLICAASSRTVRELQAVHQSAPWMAEIATVWEHWAMTPGGTVFSLNPIDQARLLALGFHQIIERLVRAEVPIRLLAFPRFATDPDYLYRKLASWLPPGTEIARARAVHAATFDDENVRVERELSSGKEPAFGQEVARYPTLHALDNAALRREMKSLRNELRVAQEQGAALVKEREALRTEVKEAKELVTAAENTRDELESAHEAVRHQRERWALAETRCSALENELGKLRDQLKRENDDKSRLLQEVLAFRASRSWRLTYPLRLIASAIRCKARFSSAA